MLSLATSPTAVTRNALSSMRTTSPARTPPVVTVGRCRTLKKCSSSGAPSANQMRRPWLMNSATSAPTAVTVVAYRVCGGAIRLP
jgi:hypothetical protein